MEEIIMTLNTALDNIQGLKIDGTYPNISRMKEAIEAILHAGDMIRQLCTPQVVPDPVPEEPENVEVEEFGNGNDSAE